MPNSKHVLKRDDIAAMSGLKKTHFMNDRAKRTNKSLGDATGLTGLGVHLIEIEPGYESTEYHRHYHEDECTFVLSGTGEVVIDGEHIAIGPGDFIGYPKGGPAHTMLNTGSTVLRCIVAGQRLAQDVADYPNKSKRIYRNEGMKWDLVSLDDIEHPIAGAKK